MPDICQPDEIQAHAWDTWKNAVLLVPQSAIVYNPPSNRNFCRLMFQSGLESGRQGGKQLGGHLESLSLLPPLVCKTAQKQTFTSWENIFLSCKACFLLFVRISDPPVLVHVQLWWRKLLIPVLQLLAACVCCILKWVFELIPPDAQDLHFQWFCWIAL